MNKELLEELDLFFDIEKYDTLEEFRLNFQNFIKTIDLRIEVSLYLLKKLKLEQKDLILSIKELEDDNHILQVANQIKKVNIICDYLGKYLNELKLERKKTKKCSKTNVSKVQKKENISKQLAKKYQWDETSTKSYLYKNLYKLGNDIRNSETIDKEILMEAKELANECVYNKVTDDQVIDGIYYVWDSIKYRLRNEPKENEKIRKPIKDIRIIFDFVIKNYKEETDKTKHDYLFNVIEYFMNYEDGYLYLKKLVEQMPKIVNVRYIKTEHGKKINEHIVIYIVREFIRNYKELINDKNSFYINKDYLKDIYFLFTECYSLYLTKEEKRQIDTLLKEFMDYANKTLTSSKRKNAVKEDLKKMYTDKFYMNRKKDFSEPINETRLESQINSVSVHSNKLIPQKNRIDLTNEETVKLINYYNAYSIIETETDIILKIHVIDFYQFVPKYTTLDDYIYNITINAEQIDHVIQNNMHMDMTREYPAITYEIKFNKNGSYKNNRGLVNSFNLYLSKIKIDKIYNNTAFIYNKDDETLKQYLDLYRVSLIKNHGDYTKPYDLIDVESYFENILNQGIMELFKKKKLPFIYSGSEKTTDEEFVTIMNNLSPILSRLDMDDFNTIHQVINTDIDEFHYSTEELKYHPTYQFNIINPLNYIGLSIQRIIHELIIKRDNYSNFEYNKEIDKITKEFEELVAILNYNIGYIDKEVLRANRGRLVKVKRIIF